MSGPAPLLEARRGLQEQHAPNISAWAADPEFDRIVATYLSADNPHDDVALNLIFTEAGEAEAGVTGLLDLVGASLIAQPDARLKCVVESSL